MAVSQTARRITSQHDSAVHRLTCAREQQRRLRDLHAPGHRLAAARADVASLEEWLHWVCAGESVAPWADGEWCPTRYREQRAPDAEPAPAAATRRFVRTPAVVSPVANTPDARDAAARDRDASADERDAAAATRDRLDQARDRDPLGPAGRQRLAAARDRDGAARDRRLAAADRAHAAAARAAAGGDDLTVALRHGAGLAAVERDLYRAHRTGDRLVLAFIDVDGLKKVNELQGHVAGDRLLKRAAESITRHMRPYDVLVRVGGDEFVCALTAITPERARERFAAVSADLASGPDAGSISVGLAELDAGDSLDGLMHRADVALLAGRGARRTGVTRRAQRSRVNHR